MELVDLLRVEPGLGRLDGVGVARFDAHLGAAAVLALADLLGDVRGEVLGAEGLGEDDGVDRLVDDLLEAGHVDAGLVGVEVDERFELGEEEAGGAAGRGGDVDDLLDAADADAGEADARVGSAGLDVAELGWRAVGLAHGVRVAQGTPKHVSRAARGSCRIAAFALILRAASVPNGGEDRKQLAGEADVLFVPAGSEDKEGDERRAARNRRAREARSPQGTERGYLTFEEISASLEEVEVTKEQVRDLHAHLIEHGVDVIAADGVSAYEEAKGAQKGARSSI